MENIFIDVIDKEYEFLCQLYWQVEGNGRFSYSMIKIEEKTQLKSKEIKTIVAKSCKAYSLKLKCVSCGEIECLRDRSHFSHLNGLEHVCIDCIRIRIKKKGRKKLNTLMTYYFVKKKMH
ncbi:hypothetical protein AB6H26_17845 [Providencia hangzhouensis]|uniref:hypothetical protein n=1 Tax=Providencia hangzhouensis TaxID=3031799 RepID=UPI0034DCC7CF